jgi:hypothetical protein
MNRILVVFSMMIACLGFLPTQASAQYGTWAYCNGGWRWQSCSGPTQVGIPSNDLVAMPGGLYNYGGTPMRCAATAVGAIAGGTLGSLAKHHTAQAVILGAIAGGVAGNVLFCERATTMPAGYPRAAFEQPGMGERNQQRVPAKCDFENGIVAYTYEGQAGCDKIASAMSKRVESTTSPTTVADNRSPAYCPIYGPGGQMKKVLNPDRREAYCGEVVRDLQARKLSWDNLATVN